MSELKPKRSCPGVRCDANAAREGLSHGVVRQGTVPFLDSSSRLRLQQVHRDFASGCPAPPDDVTPYLVHRGAHAVAAFGLCPPGWWTHENCCYRVRRDAWSVAFERREDDATRLQVVIAGGVLPHARVVIHRLNRTAQWEALLRAGFVPGPDVLAVMLEEVRDVWYGGEDFPDHTVVLMSQMATAYVERGGSVIRRCPRGLSGHGLYDFYLSALAFGVVQLPPPSPAVTAALTALFRALMARASPLHHAVRRARAGLEEARRTLLSPPATWVLQLLCEHPSMTPAERTATLNAIVRYDALGPLPLEPLLLF